MVLLKSDMSKSLEYLNDNMSSRKFVSLPRVKNGIGILLPTLITNLIKRLGNFVNKGIIYGRSIIVDYMKTF